MFSYHDCFQKLLFNTDAFKIDRTGTVVSVTTLVFTGDVEVCLQRFQWIPGLSHWRPFRFSVRWFNNLHFNSCSLKCPKNALFDMSFIKVNQNPNFYDFTGNGQYMCDSYVIWCATTHKRIDLFQTCVFYCRHGISYSYNSFCCHIDADFNGRFLTGCCCVKTNSIAKSSRPD